EVLDLSYTQIKTLPKLNLPNLGILDLANSQFRTLPNNLNLPHLCEVFLKNTPFLMGRLI
ncbi:MAG TPA: hypothetical protein VLE95_08800, partial [Chlamydiales bacterium]|nr:hypothetical protein [Chlamydiales bacterium]